MKLIRTNYPKNQTLSGPTMNVATAKTATKNAGREVEVGLRKTASGYTAITNKHEWLQVAESYESLKFSQLTKIAANLGEHPDLRYYLQRLIYDVNDAYNSQDPEKFLSLYGKLAAAQKETEKYAFHGPVIVQAKHIIAIQKESQAVMMGWVTFLAAAIAVRKGLQVAALTTPLIKLGLNIVKLTGWSIYKVGHWLYTNVKSWIDSFGKPELAQDLAKRIKQEEPANSQQDAKQHYVQPVKPTTPDTENGVTP